MPAKNNLLGLDVGSKRVGMALVADGLSIPRALPTLPNDDQLLPAIQALVAEKAIAAVVVGLPRNLAGDETPQTAAVRQFADKLQQQIKLPIYFQDEALTSVQAEQLLQASGKQFAKGDVDSLAALTILSDYILDSRKTSSDTGSSIRDEQSQFSDRGVAEATPKEETGADRSDSEYAEGKDFGRFE